MDSLHEWGVPLAVLGLVTATLLMAALVKRYQAHQALVQARVRRLQGGIEHTRQALEGLRNVPLSRELRVVLRSDVLDRYRQIARLYRRYPAIAQRIEQATATLHAEGAPASAGVGPLEDEQTFRAVVQAIDTLIDVMEQGATLKPIPRDVRAIFRRELGERRAEVNARFHLVESQRCEQRGEGTRARAHLTTLLQVLRRRGPATEFVRELHAEARQALDALTARHSASTDSPVDVTASDEIG